MDIVGVFVEPNCSLGCYITAFLATECKAKSVDRCSTLIMVRWSAHSVYIRTGPEGSEVLLITLPGFWLWAYKLCKFTSVIVYGRVWYGWSIGHGGLSRLAILLVRCMCDLMCLDEQSPVLQGPLVTIIVFRSLTSWSKAWSQEVEFTRQNLKAISKYLQRKFSLVKFVCMWYSCAHCLRDVCAVDPMTARFSTREKLNVH